MNFSRRTRRLSVTVAVAATLVTAGCGVTTQRDLCRQYSDVETAAQKLRELDTTANSPEFVQKLFADFGSEVDQFQASADGSLDIAVSGLRAALADARADVAAAANQADAQVQALLQEDLQNIRTQWAIVQQQIDVECSSRT
ncbi:MAG TPA: hypothetical protein VJN29_01465 [Intrasporangium sp.]|nr:hypothetical protein [Intrasporangium sp.]